MGYSSSNVSCVPGVVYWGSTMNHLHPAVVAIHLARHRCAWLLSVAHFHTHTHRSLLLSTMPPACRPTHQLVPSCSAVDWDDLKCNQPQLPTQPHLT